VGPCSGIPHQRGKKNGQKWAEKVKNGPEIGKNGPKLPKTGKI
jgi:hypothetical protein